MITYEQAISVDTFWKFTTESKAFNREDKKVGYKLYRIRRNGKTQTWVTRPSDFRIPVKYGLRETFQITHDQAKEFYASEEECRTEAQAEATRMAEIREGIALERRFLDTLNRQHVFYLGDSGTLETLLICHKHGHEVTCSDRESAIACLEDGICDECLNLG